MKINTIIGFFVIYFLSITASSQGSYYISDAGNFNNGPYQILKCNADGSNVQVFTKQLLAWPQDILFLEDKGIVLISNFTSNSIDRYNANTGTYVSKFTTGIQGPTRMKIGKDSLLYVLQWLGDGKVKRYDLEGNFVDNFTELGVSNSIGMDWDLQDNLYVSSYDGKYVQKFGPDGKSLGRFIANGLAGPTNIQFLENGNWMVLDYNGATIKLYDGAGKFIKNLVSGVLNCEGLHIHSDGSFLIGVGQNASVRKYDVEGRFVGHLFTPGTLQLKNPNAVVFRKDVTATRDENKIVKADFLQETGRHQFQIVDVEFTKEITTVQLLDAEGKTILTRDVRRNQTLDLSALSAGVYLALGMSAVRKAYRQKIVISE
ncbi:MAG: hypothetical protein IPM48_02775 [Saprospiraceae bacterium]|nr:hypothetical protein [Saprospiraceae bacterium]